MPTKHVVKPGECLASIARLYGFVNPMVIWDSKDNEALRKKRKNPDILFPGDKVTIPKKRASEIKVKPGGAAKMMLKPETTRLCLKVWDDHAGKCKAERYVLHVGGEPQPYFGKLTEAGEIDHVIPERASHAKLEIFAKGIEQPIQHFELVLGGTDPIDTVTGIQARLQALGYDCGGVDGQFGPLSRAALLAYQRTHGFEPTGEWDDKKLQDKLDGHFGGEAWTPAETPPLEPPKPPAAAPPPPPPAPAPEPKKETHAVVWDRPFSGRQWVNLPQAWGVSGFGPVANLVGHVEPKDAGQTVTLAVIPDASNPREAGAATLESATVTSGAEGKIAAKLRMPNYGGAKFKVSAKTADMSKAVETETITVWRKVYYQVTEMAAAPDGTRLNAPGDMISALRGAFDPVFIELAASTKATATTPYKSHLTAAERGTLETSLRTSAADDRTPFKMNIVIIDAADIVAENEWTTRTRAASVETPPFMKWRHDPTVIRAEYQSAPGTWTALAGVAVADLPGGRAKVTAPVPGPRTADVSIRIKYRFQRGRAGGWGGTTGTLFMCIGFDRRANAASPTGGELQQALTHEIGHALGLVSPTATWRDTDPRDDGYSLRHCGYLDASRQPRCVMWFMLGGSGERLRYCKKDPPNDCAHFLLTADLSTLRWI